MLTLSVAEIFPLFFTILFGVYLWRTKTDIKLKAKYISVYEPKLMFALFFFFIFY